MPSLPVYYGLMGTAKLKTAILGLNSKAELLLEAACRAELFEIQAVADKDQNLVEKVAEKYHCAAYDDYRQLVTANNFDCLLVTAGIHSCSEYVRIAMKNKFHVLKLAPPARDYEETAELVKLANQENVKFATTNTNRFAQSSLALRRLLQEGQVEQVSLITAFCAIDHQSSASWRTDPKLAGGGVLLHDCYDIIDRIVWNFGIPQQIYSLNSNTAADKQQRLYLTEDTAIVTMRFTDTFFCNIIASKTIGRQQKLLNIYSKDKIITVTDKQLLVSSKSGQVERQLEYDDDELLCMTRLLKNFGLSILSSDKNKLFCSSEENLKDMAVIESAYLSARTGFPEQPGRILQMPHVKPTNIRAVHK